MSEFISPSETETRQPLKYQEYYPNSLSVSGKEIDGQIDLNGKEIKGRTGDTVIYFGGTFENPDSKSTEELKQSLADYSGNTCYSFLATTNPEDVLKFIKEKNLDLKDIVLFGYSQGSNTATKLAKMTGKGINGLILAEPTSMYEQKQLTWNFIKEGFKTSGDILKQLKSESFGGIKRKREQNNFKKGKQLLGEVLSIGVPMVFDKKYGLKGQIENMSKKHPEIIEEVECPIIVLQGKKDKVTDYTKNSPEMFKKSKNAVRILADRHGSHGLPVMRSEQVAKVTLDLLNRNKKS